MSDYGEPWTAVDKNGCRQIVDSGGDILVTSFGKHWGQMLRAMACVNFCRNFPTEELEGEILRQSDEGHGIEYYMDIAPERKFSDAPGEDGHPRAS